MRERETEPVRLLCGRGLLDREQLTECIRLSAEAEWAEGTASFLRFSEEFFPAARDRYAFEDF